MSKLIPFVRFNDNKCREAFEFYKNCFGGGETTFMTVADSPMKGDLPAEKQGNIMHAVFKKDGIVFSGSDMMMDRAKIGDNVTMMLDCDSEEEINRFFKNLSEGGEVFMPVEKQFWGALFGVVTDKYGIEWSLNYQIEEKK